MKKVIEVEGMCCVKCAERAERKLRRLLTDFRFVDLEEADRQTDWRRVPTVQL